MGGHMPPVPPQFLGLCNSHPHTLPSTSHFPLHLPYSTHTLTPSHFPLHLPFSTHTLTPSHPHTSLLKPHVLPIQKRSEHQLVAIDELSLRVRWERVREEGWESVREGSEERG